MRAIAAGVLSLLLAATGVRAQNAEVPDRFEELRLDFEGDRALVVRAYDDGVAYRFASAFADSVVVAAEEATFDPWRCGGGGGRRRGPAPPAKRNASRSVFREVGGVEGRRSAPGCTLGNHGIDKQIRGVAALCGADGTILIYQ